MVSLWIRAPVSHIWPPVARCKFRAIVDALDVTKGVRDVGVVEVEVPFIMCSAASNKITLEDCTEVSPLSSSPEPWARVGSAFDPQNGRGVVYDGRLGGLGIATNRDRNAKLWLVNTAESTASVWQTDGQGLREIAKYRVGLPEGECPGSCF